MFLPATGKIQGNENMRNILMYIWETNDIDMKILEAGFIAQQRESFSNEDTPGQAERNLFFLQAFLSVSSSPSELIIPGVIEVEAQENSLDQHGLGEDMSSRGDFIIPRSDRRGDVGGGGGGARSADRSASPRGGGGGGDKSADRTASPHTGNQQPLTRTPSPVGSGNGLRLTNDRPTLGRFTPPTGAGKFYFSPSLFHS